MGAKVSAVLTEQLGVLSDYSLREVRAVLVHVCGVPVHEEYRSSTAQETHNVASVTKSVIGTLVGIALADGSLKSLEQTLGELLPEHRAVMSPAVASIRLRQLLTMTAGLDADLPDSSVGAWIQSDHFVEGILRQGVVGNPGTFAYSSASSHLLSAIVARATHRSVLDYATEKLFEPLGIKMTGAAQPLLVKASAAAYDKARFAWPVDHQGINYGAGWLKLRPQDMAKLGQVYLDHGTWQGKQIVPQSWVQDATTGHVDVGAQGADRYGYQWWVTTAGGHPAYAALGFGGQLVEVVPDKALVVVFATHVDTLASVAQGPSLHFYQNVVSGALVPTLP
ncbi:CubicO group peptidase (beta-lactamase class C family) [Humibacillus xanthopallidus]|uniref:CubicO group peptidase (Beta-lactamase class C family) n=1 Tax=Humibacillus xanthopallidus TaxID=412689 RepID=A0A543PTN9_9MICO|nr:serine hydrolase [Humibacillus xanthopallidus]TQN47443.1 CubicO group peptidase (beta-lactamase class C family) [Humibacillus xanthopallidus]